MKFLVVIGTRPEAIKLAPVVHALRGRGHFVFVHRTGQHPVNDLLFTLDVYETNNATDRDGSCGSPLFQRYLMADEIHKFAPTYTAVIGQGDTTSCVAAAEGAFYARVPFVHVEAGLRTWRLDSPFPEEYHRQVCSLTARLNCCPTEDAAHNCWASAAPGIVRITGQTGLDSLRQQLEGYRAKKLDKTHAIVTLHRRENWPRVAEWAQAVTQLASDKSLHVTWLLHHSTRKAVEEALRHTPIQRMEPLPYPSMCRWLAKADIVLTDSGGLQEECAYLRIPTLVLRDTTEREEAVDYGTALLVEQPKYLSRCFDIMASRDLSRLGDCPYGDGHAAEKVVDAIEEVFQA